MSQRVKPVREQERANFGGGGILDATEEREKRVPGRTEIRL